MSNITACQAVAEAVRTTLGPRGMDKLVVEGGGKATISNDGATIMKLLEVVHPAAKNLVEIARSQDAEVGDGTTTVVLLAAELLKQLRPLIEEGMHPQVAIRGLRRGTSQPSPAFASFPSALRALTPPSIAVSSRSVLLLLLALSWFPP